MSFQGKRLIVLGFLLPLYGLARDLLCYLVTEISQQQELWIMDDLEPALNNAGQCLLNQITILFGEYIMKITKFLIAGAFTLASFGVNAATNIVTHEDTVSPVPLITDVSLGIETVGPFVIGEDFLWAVNFSTDADAVTAAAGALSIELSPIVGLADPVTIALFEGPLSVGADISGLTFVDSGNVDPTGGLTFAVTGVPISASTAYTFLVQGTSTGSNTSITAHVAVSSVPVPAAAWLFGSGLIGLAGIARRKKATA